MNKRERWESAVRCEFRASGKPRRALSARTAVWCEMWGSWTPTDTLSGASTCALPFPPPTAQETSDVHQRLNLYQTLDTRGRLWGNLNDPPPFPAQRKTPRAKTTRRMTVWGCWVFFPCASKWSFCVSSGWLRISACVCFIQKSYFCW